MPALQRSPKNAEEVVYRKGEPLPKISLLLGRTQRIVKTSTPERRHSPYVEPHGGVTESFHIPSIKINYWRQSGYVTFKYL